MKQLSRKGYKIKQKKQCAGTPLQCGLRRSAKILAFGFAFILVVVAAYELFINDGDYIWFGVKVDGVALGGLSPQAAALKLEQAFGKKYQRPIVLQIDGNGYAYSPQELGLSADFAAAVAQAAQVGRSGSLLNRWHSRQTERNLALDLFWQPETFYYTLRPLANLYRQPPQAARVVGVEGEAVAARPEQDGSYWDFAAALEQLQQQPAGSWRAVEQPFTIAVQQKELAAYPSLEQLQNWRLEETLASYETYYQVGGNRGKNIELFASWLNGAVLYPYQVFSVNQYLGERTAAKGYLPAPMIVEGKHEDALAGGICQVVSTLYNAIYEQNQQQAVFTIVERHQHSLPVEYVPEGRDATVAYGLKDFIFYCTGPAPIVIQAEAADGVLRISLGGSLK